MFNFLKFIFLYDAPDKTSGSGTGVEELPALDDVDFLESDTKEEDSEDVIEEEEEEEKKKEDVKDEEPDEEGDEDSEEEDDEEDEEEDEEESKEDEVIINGRVSVKALKEQYPDIFKKNPGLKDIIFREREYAKRFGSIEDAEEAYAKSESFDNFEATLLRGGIGELIDAVADTDQNAAVKLAENFLPELYARSKQVFAQVTMPVVKGTIRNVFVRAQNQGNKQLALACQYISRDLFETPDVLRATEFENSEPDPRAEELDRKKAEIYQGQVESARNDVLNNVKGKLAKDISKQLSGNLSEFTRDALVSKITDELDATLAKDKAHMAHLSSLWKRMSRNGFNSEAKSRIISASLARARQLLPSVITKVKTQQKGKPSGDKKVLGTKTKQIPNQPSSKNRAGLPAKLDRNMSDFEFISK